MTDVFMPDPVTGRCGFYAENGSSGDPYDTNSSRNAPLNNPFAYFANLVMHSDCDLFEVAFSGTHTINHALIAGVTAASGLSTPYNPSAPGDDNVLVTHSLGYPPLALVAANGNIIWPGMPVQTVTDASGGARYATPYVDNTTLHLSTNYTIGATSLAAKSITYQYLVFKAPPAALGDVLFDFNADGSGLVEFGFGKFSSDRAYLQYAPGGSPLGISFGKTIDLANGAPKAWNPDGTSYAPVPTALNAVLEMNSFGTEYPTVAGASMAYNGSYAGPPGAFEVQAP